jgi:hypothetical protein
MISKQTIINENNFNKLLHGGRIDRATKYMAKHFFSLRSYGTDFGQFSPHSVKA